MRKPAAIKISVPQPCHEGWGGMTPAAGGRHCAACDKVVTDFAVMTDRELVDYFRHYKGGGCGRFSETQLSRVIEPPAEVRHSWWIKVGLAAMVFIGLADSSRAQQVKGRQAHHLSAKKKKRAAPEYPELTPDQKLMADRIDSLASITTFTVGRIAYEPAAKEQVLAEPGATISTPSTLEPWGPQTAAPAEFVTKMVGSFYMRPTRWQRFKHGIHSIFHSKK